LFWVKLCHVSSSGRATFPHVCIKKCPLSISQKCLEVKRRLYSLRLSNLGWEDAREISQARHRVRLQTPVVNNQFRWGWVFDRPGKPPAEGKLLGDHQSADCQPVAIGPRLRRN